MIMCESQPVPLVHPLQCSCVAHLCFCLLKISPQPLQHFTCKDFQKTFMNANWFIGMKSTAVALKEFN